MSIQRRTNVDLTRSCRLRGDCWLGKHPRVFSGPQLPNKVVIGSQHRCADASRSFTCTVTSVREHLDATVAEAQSIPRIQLASLHDDCLAEGENVVVHVAVAVRRRANASRNVPQSCSLRL